jgi:hypothetical protein
MEMDLAGDKSDSVPDYDVAVFYCYLKSFSISIPLTIGPTLSGYEA